MKVDEDDGTTPSDLSDQELRILESTLRVQLHVSKHVRVAQVSGAIGTIMLSGPLAAVPSGVTIVSSQVQRRKLKRRHRDVTREMRARGGLACVVSDASQLSKRAIAISMGTGSRAVVSEVVTGMVDDLAMDSLAGLVTAQLATATPVSSSTQPPANTTPSPTPLKPMRSWGGFASKWTTKRAAKKGESLPPDLFGEREPLAHDEIPQQVEVRRSNEFGPYGECLVLRFTTIVPDNEEMKPPHHRLRCSTIVGESDALSEDHWLALWTLEDGPMDVLDDDTEVIVYDLFGTDKPLAVVEDDYDLFGVSAETEPQRATESYDLFGEHETVSN